MKPRLTDGSEVLRFGGIARRVEIIRQIRMGGCTAHLHQFHFQGFNNNNSAADVDDCTSLAAIDTNFTIDVDTIFGLRFEIEETANCSSMNNQFHIQHNINGAGFVTTTTTTSGVRLANGVANDALLTTNRISGSALGFVAGEYDEEGITANVTLQNQHSEMHFVLELVGADLNDADTITFRVITGAATLTEYHVTPTVTANKAAGPQTLTPAPVVASFAVPAPTLSVGGVTLTPASVVAAWGVPAATVDSGGPQTLIPDPVVASWAISAPSLTGIKILTPEAVIAMFGVPSPSILTGAVALVADPVLAQFVVPAATIVVPGSGGKKYRPRPESIVRLLVVRRLGGV